jgi:hypothetical protein
VLYEGQKLKLGSYRIFIKDSPAHTKMPPVFYTTKDGKSQPSIVRNMTINTTSIELEHAWACGYTQIYLIDCIVSHNEVAIFKDFIEKQYA